MEKRQHSVRLSIILLRFGFMMMISMFFCCVLWYAMLSYLESRKIVYPGYVGNQQVEEIIEKSPDTFRRPGDDFLADYAWFDDRGNLLISNVEGKMRSRLMEKAAKNSTGILQHSYADGSYAIFSWHFRKEFSDPVWRASLPPFEYLWWTTLGIACIFCWFLNAFWLRKRIVQKLYLFSEVSEKVGARELDFEIPHAGIREFDQALEAMDRMKNTLYDSLSSQWAAQQQRDSEMAALAHDLKTPITLIGGNAELLLEDDLPKNHRKMVETILESNDCARQYVESLLETSRGENEDFEYVPLTTFFEELYRKAYPVSQAGKIHLKIENDSGSCVKMQKQHLLRAIGNIVFNAIEHTKAGGAVRVESSVDKEKWNITVYDEGPGFSEASIQHATERLWRGDSARTSTGHNGLGLWFARQVIQNHSGQIVLGNTNNGAVVVISIDLK